MGLHKPFVFAIVASGLLGFAQPAEAQLAPIGDVTGTVTQGKKKGTFDGTFTIERFRVVENKLVAVGKLNGEVEFEDGKTRDIKNAKVVIPVNLEKSKAYSSSARTVSSVAQPLPISCDVLNLNLGPLDLNLLGLEIHLDEVILDIVANPTGGLLGSLLSILCGLGLSTLLDLLGLLLGNLDLLAFLLNLILLLG
jgi:hypothetical protein